MASLRGNDSSGLLSNTDLERLIAAGESDLIEFKQEWYELSDKKGKAVLVKDVLALANMARPEAPGYLLVGVADDKQVVGITDPPNAETVSQILADSTDPPVNVHCRDYQLNGKTVSVLTTSWSPATFHRSLRDYPEILSSSVIYMRRDRTVSTLTLAEIATRIREKESRLGPISREPIQFGFVQTDASRTGLVARVSNVTTEPVGGVDVMIELRNARDPMLVSRARRLSNATLGPGESREVEVRMNEITFYLPAIDPNKDDRTLMTMQNFGRLEGDRWMDATLHVDYRDRDGFIRHMEQKVAVEI